MLQHLQIVFFDLNTTAFEWNYDVKLEPFTSPFNESEKLVLNDFNLVTYNNYVDNRNNTYDLAIQIGGRTTQKGLDDLPIYTLFNDIYFISNKPAELD